jgi:hypothetical protein
MDKDVPQEQRDAILTRVCERIAEGESLRTICKDEDMPNRNTINEWIGASPQWATKCALAREAQGDVMDEKQMDTLADMRSGVIDADVGRVEIAVYQWRAKKLRPRVYGDALQVEHSGNIGNAIAERLADGRKRLTGSLTGTE